MPLVRFLRYRPLINPFLDAVRPFFALPAIDKSVLGCCSSVFLRYRPLINPFLDAARPFLCSSSGVLTFIMKCYVEDY